MKSYWLTYLVLFFFSISGSSQSPQESTYNFNNTFMVSVSHFFASEYRLTYERYLNNHRFSIAFSPSYVLNKKPSIWLNNNVFQQISGVGANLQIKLHLFNKYGPIIANRKGTTVLDIYSAPYFQYFHLKHVDENVSFLTDGFEDDLYVKGEPIVDIIDAYEGGVMLGIEIAIHQRFIMEFAAGAGYRYSHIESIPYSFPMIRTGYWSRGFTGVVPRLGINFGFTF